MGEETGKDVCQSCQKPLEKTRRTFYEDIFSLEIKRGEILVGKFSFRWKKDHQRHFAEIE